MSRIRRPALAYGIVFLAIGVGLTVRLVALGGIDGVSPFLLFHFAVLAGGWYGGFRAGLCATLVGIVLGNVFVSPPQALAWPLATGAIQSVVFFGQGVFLSAILEARLRDVERSQERSDALRRLTSELTLSEERERRRLAHGLHDHLQQLLLASRLQITLLKKHVGAGPVCDAADQTDELLAQAIEFTRNLTADLCPPVLGDLGLLAGLQWTAAEFGRRFGLRVEVRGDAEADPASEEIRVQLFHCVRELLFNVAKHAGTNEAVVCLACDGAVVRLSVEDGGVGYDPAEVTRRDGDGGRFGLFSIRERLAAIGGSVETVTSPGDGVRTTLVAPLEAPPVRAELTPPRFTSAAG